MEPYRIPDNIKVREIVLRNKRKTPSSTYVGRAEFEKTLGESYVKSIHITSACCSNFFKDGVTECKIAIENKPYSEIVKFLKSVSNLTVRDKSWQILSAAFCINVPIIDDRNPENIVQVNNKFDIGMLAIDAVYEAGIEKVTWDGTKDSYPSQCIFEQLTFEECVSLVHYAHEKGLICYFSAGFRFNHIEDVVYTGVDGVGLGGAQLLRYMDKTNGNHGPFIYENIEKLIDIRNRSEKNILGVSAIKLAKLDALHYKGNLSDSLNKVRVDLFENIKTKNEVSLLKINNILSV